jgi:hypothetical protein
LGYEKKTPKRNSATKLSLKQSAKKNFIWIKTHVKILEDAVHRNFENPRKFGNKAMKGMADGGRPRRGSDEVREDDEGAGALGLLGEVVGKIRNQGSFSFKKLNKILCTCCKILLKINRKISSSLFPLFSFNLIFPLLLCSFPSRHFLSLLPSSPSSLPYLNQGVP